MSGGCDWGPWAGLAGYELKGKHWDYHDRTYTGSFTEHDYVTSSSTWPTDVHLRERRGQSLISDNESDEDHLGTLHLSPFTHTNPPNLHPRLSNKIIRQSPHPIVCSVEAKVLCQDHRKNGAPAIA